MIRTGLQGVDKSGLGEATGATLQIRRFDQPAVIENALMIPGRPEAGFIGL
jgi:hypothetical protein